MKRGKETLDVDISGNVSGRSVVKKAVSNKKKKKRRFLRTRVWINYILSSFVKDRGSIPNDIGDRILITNNVFITRYFISSIIHVQSLGLKTPVTLESEINEALRKEGSTAVCDFILKNSKFVIDQKSYGLESRARIWEVALNAKNVTEKERETAARCLYTKKLLEDGEQLFYTRMYIILRAKSGTELSKAEQIVYNFLHKIEAEYSQVVGNIKETLMYIMMLSDQKPSNIRDLRAIITSTQTLSQMLPNTGSFNDGEGSYLGINVLNNSHFNFDWKKITIARNVYVVAPAGVGKTVLALNACCSARENGMAVCIQDIKGNEATNFIKGTGGYIVSLRPDSTGFINSWRMLKEDTTDEGAEMYFKSRVNFSKEQIMLLSGVTDPEDKLELEELLEEFHESLYVSLGVVAENRNSWVYSDKITPYDVYDKLCSYMTPAMQKKYNRISKIVFNSLKITMSRNGSKSYLFKEEFDYASILRAPTLMFDFGILDGATDNKDTTIFKLKFAYMRKLNAEYVAYKYAMDIKVFKVLEESQIAARDPDILRGYVEEYTLRRAQGQTTWLLGNSVSALSGNPMSKALIENTRGLFIGELNNAAKEVLVKEFGLEDFTDMIDLVGSSEEYKNSFLFINKMEKNPAVPIVKVELDKSVKYKLFTPVPVKSVM